MSEITLKEVITAESYKLVETMLNKDCVTLGVEIMPQEEDRYFLIYRRYTNQTDTTHVLSLVKKGKEGKPCYFGNFNWFIITAGYRYINEIPRYTKDDKYVVIPKWLQVTNLAKWCLFQAYCSKQYRFYK